jgi:hypothetical protein
MSLPKPSTVLQPTAETQNAASRHQRISLYIRRMDNSTSNLSEPIGLSLAG